MLMQRFPGYTHRDLLDASGELIEDLLLIASQEAGVQDEQARRKD